MNNETVQVVYDKFGRAFPKYWLNPTDIYYTRPIQLYPYATYCSRIEGVFGSARVYVN